MTDGRHLNGSPDGKFWKRNEEMSVKINTLSEAEIRSIGDAFADFAYAENEWGMSYLGKDRQAVSEYICAYVRMAIKERVLYATSEKHEASERS